MKRLVSAVLLSVAVAMPTMAQKNAKTLSNGYPFTQVPFTSVKISQNTFWGARLKAAREVTVPLAFSKCESEHRYKNFEMAAYTLQHPNHPGLDTKEWDVSSSWASLSMIPMFIRPSKVPATSSRLIQTRS